MRFCSSISFQRWYVHFFEIIQVLIASGCHVRSGTDHVPWHVRSGYGPFTTIRYFYRDTSLIRKHILLGPHKGLMAVLGGLAFSYERVAPVGPGLLTVFGMRVHEHLRPRPQGPPPLPTSLCESSPVRAKGHASPLCPDIRV